MWGPGVWGEKPFLNPFLAGKFWNACTTISEIWAHSLQWVWQMWPPRWITNSTLFCMLFVRVNLVCPWKGSTAKNESRWHLEISAAHHSIPDHNTWQSKALGAYWRTSDTQMVARKRASRVSRNDTFCQQTGPRGKSFRGKSVNLFFCFDGYGSTLSPSGNWWNSDPNPHLYSYATFLAGILHESSPPLTPSTPNQLVLCRSV